MATKKTTRTIIKADDVKKALRGEQVEPLRKKQDLARATVQKAWEQMSLVFLWEVKPEEKYFAGIASMDELQAKYKELVLIHHPDKGGNADVMAAINAEYDAKSKELAGTGTHKKSKRTEKAAGMTADELETAIAEEFKHTMEALVKLNLDGVAVELIGSWLWVSGDTKKIKEELKEIGFYWNRDRVLWQWHDTYINYRFNKGRNKSEKEEIEEKYGKTVLKGA